MTQKSQHQTTAYDLVANLQKNIASIATELDEIRFHKPSDLNILNLNVGRLQGLAQSLDWYLMQLSRQKRSSLVPFGFQMAPTPDTQEEEEYPEEPGEEEDDEELRK